MNAGELIKGLQCKHKNLSLEPQQLHKKPSMAVGACDASTEQR